MAKEDQTIAGLAAAGGVGVETVRYYQRRGLLAVPLAPVRGGREQVRRYGPEALRQLRFIRTAQAAGFTLAQIRELKALDASEDRPRARALAREQIAVLDRKIAELSAARAALDRLAQACGSGSSGPCPILDAFEHGGECGHKVQR
ncbi:MerR family DNA-binding protein [Rhizobium sp. YIM 134829]|uniref:MerR family DNA-binding protein n=1 Tax=Rhizobium sp. YIM 134829 TaxID=3390453 RepID=UPI0039794DE1